MKKLFSVLLLLSVIAALFSSCNTSVKPTVASEQTLTLAESVVHDLESQGAFGPTGVSAEHAYDTAKWVAPGIVELEKKEDSAVALIELYEKLLSEFRSFDIDAYNEITILKKDPAENADAYSRGSVIMRTRIIIEKLLSYDVYYNRLDDQTVSRMMDDFYAFDSIYYDSAIKYDAQWTHGIIFKR